MKDLKNFLLTLGMLFTFSFPILATDFSKEEIQEQATRSSISNTWGISEKDMEEAFKKIEHLVRLMEFGRYFKRLNDKWKEVLG